MDRVQASLESGLEPEEETGPTARQEAVTNEVGSPEPAIPGCSDILQRGSANAVDAPPKAQQLESEAMLRAMSAAALDAIVMLDNTGRIVSWNDAASRVFGHSAQEALGMDAHLLLAPARFHDAYRTAWPRFAKDGRGQAVGKVLELEARRKDDTEFPIELSVAPVHIKGHWHAVGIVRDITERKQAEEALRRSNRALRTISACNSALVRAAKEEQLLTDMCNAVVEHGSYRLAWIGFVEHDDDKSIRQVASAGCEEGCSSLPTMKWADTGCGQNAIARAVQMGSAQITQDIIANPPCANWREHAINCGYASCCTLPLKKPDGEVFAVLNVCAAEPQAFDHEETCLLQELADDVAFGVITLRTREQRDMYQRENLKSLEKLRGTLLGTIRAVANMVEQRDPYTAGHQGRVANLACAIARELGLDDSRIEGLRLSALIHDIGKVSIPAEILNRPGKLSPPEFEIVKSHVQAGYEIIKDIEFPWPVATIILQHHERIDGSGYPQGLKGDAICPEARILAIADVVDAVSAHRPYRAALGIEHALANIEASRDQTLDAQAVDACLRLFREKGYSLSDEKQ